MTIANWRLSGGINFGSILKIALAKRLCVLRLFYTPPVSTRRLYSAIVAVVVAAAARQLAMTTSTRASERKRERKRLGVELAVDICC